MYFEPYIRVEHLTSTTDLKNEFLIEKTEIRLGLALFQNMEQGILYRR